ncbi:RluA family pseudouridine synthase [Rubrimonas cliftonensis]|nr:pseudouridine synthase [Rubrimonas cliftonensis]
MHLQTFVYSPPPGLPEPLHADADLLAFDKPAGLLTVPGRDPERADCLETRVKAAWPGALLVHRLDMATSGVIVFARNRRAQRHLGLQFERRIARKTYLARVLGAPAADSGVVDLPIAADWERRPLQKICGETGRPSRTRWRVVERRADASLMALRPFTGRSHQLRVHLAEIGLPILGDEFYAPAEALAGVPRLMLHAARLALRRPADGSWIILRAPRPTSFA